jgi:hypothetical protein
VDDYNLDEQIEFIPLEKGKSHSLTDKTTLAKGKYNLFLGAL